MQFELESSWELLLSDTLKSEWYGMLLSKLEKEYKEQTVFPPKKDVFNALNYTTVDNVKVVILGQDPYHGRGQAHGLCFSVPDGVKQPPSLRNIIKELNSDMKLGNTSSTNLSSWAKQGVLLINAIFTVREKLAGSHQKIGWEKFTDSIIQGISEHNNNCVFILWGNYAQKKEKLIDAQKHCIIKSVHPSPLSSHRGFFGSKPFSKTNSYLIENNITPIDWSLPSIKESQQTALF